MSQIIATTLSNGSVSVPTATVVNGSAKAWINFDGTGTIAARDSFNVASLTDNATGDYRVNFSTALPDGDYATAGSCRTPGVVSGTAVQFDVYNTTDLRFYTRNLINGSEVDFSIITAAIFR